MRSPHGLDEQTVERDRRIMSALRATVSGRRHVSRVATAPAPFPAPAETPRRGRGDAWRCSRRRYSRPVRYGQRPMPIRYTVNTEPVPLSVPRRDAERTAIGIVHLSSHSLQHALVRGPAIACSACATCVFARILARRPRNDEVGMIDCTVAAYWQCTSAFSTNHQGV